MVDGLLFGRVRRLFTSIVPLQRRAGFIIIVMLVG